MYHIQWCHQSYQTTNYYSWSLYTNTKLYSKVCVRNICRSIQLLWKWQGLSWCSSHADCSPSTKHTKL